jgi:hypothetical protein
VPEFAKHATRGKSKGTPGELQGRRTHPSSGIDLPEGARSSKAPSTPPRRRLGPIHYTR